MTPTAAIGRLADSVTAAALLPGGCHYPSQPQPAPRSGQVRWMGFERPDAEPDGQLWVLRVALNVIGPALNESTYDVAAIDPLVQSVADHFDASNPAAHHLEGGGDRVDHVRVASGDREPFQGFYSYRMDLVVTLNRAAGA